MASSKYQTRFVIPRAGRYNRLISIREKTAGGLNITCHVNRLMTSNRSHDPNPKAIKESRYSIHVSESSASNTVHQTTEMMDGSQRHAYLSTYAIHNRYYAPLVTSSVPHARALDTLEKAKGPVIAVPEYNPDHWTMFYQLWICAPGMEKQAAPFLQEKCEFKRFTLIIPICFVPKPTPPRVTNTFYQTTTEEKMTAEQKAAGWPAGPAEGFPPNQMVAFAVWEFNKAIARGFSIGPQLPESWPPKRDLFAEFFPLPELTHNPSR